MSLIQLAIAVIVVVAVIGIVAWFLRKNNLTVPEPVMIGFYAILAIIMILFIAGLAGWGPMIIRV